MGYDVFFTSKTSVRTILISSLPTVETMNLKKKVFGQLVTLGFDVAVFTPASYQRHRL